MKRIAHCLIVLAALAASRGVVLANTPPPQVAGRTVVVLFTGFSGSSATGLPALQTSIQATLGGIAGHPVSSMVFSHIDQAGAFAWATSFPDLECLVIIGHSFGGDSAIELVTDFLDPAGINTDLLIQLDSVGIGDEVLPASVDLGCNYFQIATGVLESQGATHVMGSNNINVETLFGADPEDITHTNIDCPLFEYTPAEYQALFGNQPDLHSRLITKLALTCGIPGIPTLSEWALIAMALTVLVIGVRKSRRPALIPGRA